MVVGYVRLSKDDNKKDYVSIENQKLILSQYANKEGLKIERWYEDDGVSGYTFERPGFLRLLTDLERDVDLILAKDLSRIGRHNARVLLFLEEVKEMGKRIIVTDDTYDSLSEEDDTIGIKTWFNERYVKDTSKKIKRAMKARQIEGTLAVNTPMGYRRNSLNKSIIEIDERAAPYIQRIFNLYIEGYGFRAIAELLYYEGVPTASMLEKERLVSFGKPYHKKVSLHWSPKMVGEIIKNDIYIGNMRYHKNERVTIHGKDSRVSRGNQIIFLEHHPPIIDTETFKTAQNILQKRLKSLNLEQISEDESTVSMEQNNNQKLATSNTRILGSQQTDHHQYLEEKQINTVQQSGHHQITYEKQNITGQQFDHHQITYEKQSNTVQQTDHHQITYEKQNNTVQQTDHHQFINEIQYNVRQSGKGANKYRGLLYCKSCGSRLTAIQRKTKDRYYICGTYNTKGKQFCSQSNQIKEKDLDNIIHFYRKLYLESNSSSTNQIYQEILEGNKIALENKIKRLEKEYIKEKEELKYILLQKAKSAVNASSEPDLMEEIRNELESDKVSNLQCLLKQMLEQKELLDSLSQMKILPLAELVDADVTRQELVGLIERIIIAEDGSVEIILKYPMDAD